MPRFDPLPDRRPALVAGASSGIGEATAIKLAANGFPVALGARRVEKLKEIVDKIRADGGEAVAVHLDVTDPEPLPMGHPLWSAPGLLLTPHVAGSTEGAWQRAWAVARDQIERYAGGGVPSNLVAGPGLAGR